MADTEKITINMSAVDLGKVDLLVQEGLYSNRTDFIRTAIRSQLEKHAVEVQQSISRHSYGIGVFSYNRADLEEYKARNQKLKLTVVGLLSLSSDITPALASDVIEAVQVRGIFQASDQVKAALADRTK
jgi:Arc/MetJ-type ribon-helix-helix transcriptional regulator